MYVLKNREVHFFPFLTFLIFNTNQGDVSTNVTYDLAKIRLLAAILQCLVVSGPGEHYIVFSLVNKY